MRMMRKALEHSYSFIRGLYRFSFRDRIKHPSKLLHRKFKFRKVEHVEQESKKGKTVRYWLIILLVPLILLIISFSFISDPTKFFSKGGGINVSDMKKFIIIPGLAILFAIGYMLYSYLKSKKTDYFPKRKNKHIKIRNKNKKEHPDGAAAPQDI